MEKNWKVGSFVLGRPIVIGNLGGYVQATRVVRDGTKPRWKVVNTKRAPQTLLDPKPEFAIIWQFFPCWYPVLITGRHRNHQK